MLTVPTPVLTQKKVATTQFTSDQAIELECAPITFPDGELLILERMVTAGFWTQRQLGGGSLEVWNEASKQWESGPTPPALQPLFFKDNAWKAVLVPVGQKNRFQQDKFATDPIIGFPQYSVKCVFKGRDSRNQEHEGISVDSAKVRIRPLGEEQNARLFILPKDDPASATAIGLLLQDKALTTERGKIVITEESGGVRVELVGSGAQVQLLPSGDIVLRPRSGAEVRVASNLHVDGTVTATGYFP